MTNYIFQTQTFYTGKYPLKIVTDGHRYDAMHIDDDHDTYTVIAVVNNLTQYPSYEDCEKRRQLVLTGVFDLNEYLIG